MCAQQRLATALTGLCFQNVTKRSPKCHQKITKRSHQKIHQHQPGAAGTRFFYGFCFRNCTRRFVFSPRLSVAQISQHRLHDSHSSFLQGSFFSNACKAAQPSSEAIFVISFSLSTDYSEHNHGVHSFAVRQTNSAWVLCIMWYIVKWQHEWYSSTPTLAHPPPLHLLLHTLPLMFPLHPVQGGTTCSAVCSPS